MTTYADFLAAKLPRDDAHGLPDAKVPDAPLFDWQAEIVQWAARRSRAALFTATGTGKTRMQLAWAHSVHAATNRDVLILAPLAVSAQTAREGAAIGLPVTVCREATDARRGVNITNYERLDRFDPGNYGALVLDESSILRNYSGTVRQQIQAWAERVPHRLAATATPVPNDVMEITNHSEFVGAMRGKEVISLFFVADDASLSRSYRLKGHAQREFFGWLASWSIALRTPADLGYPDDGYILPGLEEREIIVPSGRDPGAQLFVQAASSMGERREARLSTVDARADAIAELVHAEPDEPWLVWCDYNAEADAMLDRLPGAVEVRGSMPAEEKEEALLGFADGDVRVLVTKPSIAGHGMNFQRCARIGFVGVADSWEQRYQGIRRCLRFGQERVVKVWTARADDEQNVVDNVARKARQADNLMEGMVAAMASSWQSGNRERVPHERDLAIGDDWVLHLGDSTDVLDEFDAESVGLSVFSPPFPGMYVYSDSERDVGNSQSIAELVEHSRFIMGQRLLRVTMPGRLACVHLMQLPAYETRDGYAGIQDYRGPVIAMMCEEGWTYAGEVTIDKNPQVQATRHKEHGLLFKTLSTDASRLRMALADYLLVFRKPGENLDPIQAGISEKYNPDGGWVTQEEWIEWAAPVWYRATKGLPGGIRETNVLNVAVAREDRDERHLCPLQLGVIERCVKLWSNPGDVVLSPFAGIGSEGYVALQHNRRFVGIELKRSYWQTAQRNLQAATAARGQGQLDVLGAGR